MLLRLALLALLISPTFAADDSTQQKETWISLVDPSPSKVSVGEDKICSLIMNKTCVFDFTFKVGDDIIKTGVNLDIGGGIKLREAPKPSNNQTDQPNDLPVDNNVTIFDYCYTYVPSFVSFGHPFEACLDEARFVVRDKRSQKMSYNPLLRQESQTPELPISAVYINSHSDDHISLFTFDLRGNMVGSQWLFKAYESDGLWVLRPNVEAKVIKRRVSSIVYPASTRDYAPPLGSIDFLPQDLKSKFEKDIEVKYRSAFIGAITPIYLNATTQELPEDQKTVALCVHRNLMRDVYCRHKGADQVPFVDSLDIPLDPRVKLISHALHAANHNGSRFMHFVYSIVVPDAQNNNVTTKYMLCKRKGILSPNTRQSNSINLEGKVADGCSAKDWDDYRPIPTDIIGFNDGKCIKNIAFYHNAYTVSDIDREITHIQKDAQTRFPGWLMNRMTYVQAAMAIGRKIYFFEGSNTMMTVAARMDDACKTLIFEEPTFRQMLTQPFIHANAWQKDNDPPMERPHIVYWRRFINDTRVLEPSIEYSSPVQETFIEPIRYEITTTPAPDGPNVTEVPNPKQANNTSTIVMIVIGCVLGGLILASIIYLFWIKGDSPAARMRARKSQPAPSHSGSSLNHPTMRSALSQVPTESKMVTKSPMPPNKSRAGSPKSRSKKSPNPTSPKKSQMQSPRSPMSPKSRSKPKVNLPPKPSMVTKSSHSIKSPHSPKSSSKR